LEGEAKWKDPLLTELANTPGILVGYVPFEVVTPVPKKGRRVRKASANEGKEKA
jgi:hypothetical protein